MRKTVKIIKQGIVYLNEKNNIRYYYIKKVKFIYKAYNIVPILYEKMINHYKILNLSEDATELQIKKAFRRLVLKIHPDKTKSHNTNEFLLIKNSYDILINPYKRKIYDQKLYDFRNLKREFHNSDSKNNKRNSGKTTTEKRILNIFLQLVISAVLIIVIVNSCEFIDNKILGSEKKISMESLNTKEKRISDSIKNEDLKIEKNLESTKEKVPPNGNIKF